MKKMTLTLSLAFVAAIAFQSCKKKTTCVCTVDDIKISKEDSNKKECDAENVSAQLIGGNCELK